MHGPARDEGGAPEAPATVFPRTSAIPDTAPTGSGLKGIADTGFLVALANRDDARQAWAVDVASRVTEPLLICETVLADLPADA